MRRRNRWWLIALAFVVIAGGCVGLWIRSGKQNKPLQAAYQTTQVRKGNLEVKISGTGNIQPVNRESLKATSSGTVDVVKAKQGDKVKKGQVIATLVKSTNTSTNTVADQIRSKQIDLKKKQLDLETLMTQFKQAPDDDKRNEISINLQKQQLDIQSTQADIQSLQADNTSLDPITAPIDGTLATFTLSKGDTVGGQGNSSSTLGEVVDYNHLQMTVGVDELDISKVKPDQKASVLVEALPDQTFTGKVTDIAQEGTASNGVSSFNVTIALDDVQNLKAGMSAEASILTDQKANALYLPIEAVQSFGNRYFVMVPSTGSAQAVQTASSTAQGSTPSQTNRRKRNGGQAGFNQGGQNAANGTGNSARPYNQSAASAQSGMKRIPVQVGIHNEDYIEITSGLKEGEAVIIPTVASSSTSQNRNGAGAIPGLGLGGGFQGGGFGGGSRQSGGNRQSSGNARQGGGSGG
ncbi:MAG: efflux transporter periplasmic adaptor subunit [Cohnella sp.]|nr:efflux transporter periplasmic adaptor subunit [Cohnella sp.]